MVKYLQFKKSELSPDILGSIELSPELWNKSADLPVDKLGEIECIHWQALGAIAELIKDGRELMTTQKLKDYLLIKFPKDTIQVRKYKSRSWDISTVFTKEYDVKVFLKAKGLNNYVRQVNGYYLGEIHEDGNKITVN